MASSPDSIRISTVSRPRRVRNAVMLGLISLSLLVALLPLGAVFVNLISRGAHLFGWAFVTKPIPTPRETGPGMGPAVVGTIIISPSGMGMSLPFLTM